MCIPCRIGDHDRCEAKHGAITPCTCATCFPPKSGDPGSGLTSLVQYVDFLLASMERDQGSLFDSTGKPLQPHTARRFVNVIDPQGRV